MRASDAVIDAPGHLSRGRRLASNAFTLGAWVLYAGMLLPSLRAVAGVVRGALREGPSCLVHALPPALLVLCASSVGMSVVLLTWAEVQRRRFTGVERRQRAPSVAVSEIAEAMRASEEVVSRLRSGRVLRVHLREDGSPERVEILASAAPEAPEAPEETLASAAPEAPAGTPASGPGGGHAPVPRQRTRRTSREVREPVVSSSAARGESGPSGRGGAPNE